MDDRTRHAARLWTLALPGVSAFVASLVQEFSERDDVLQETAVAVMESFERYDSSQPFMAWAIGIARNQVRLHWRRKQRERVTFDSDTLEALAAAFTNEPVDDGLRFLADCFGLLDQKAKELCRLRYESDLKPAAIAGHVGAQANGIAKALQRIRDRLRECIERKLRAAQGPA